MSAPVRLRSGPCVCPKSASVPMMAAPPGRRDAPQFLHQMVHARVAADTQDLHQTEAVGGVGGALRQRQACGVRAHAQHVVTLRRLG